MDAPSIAIALRIPGRWAHPKELIQLLPPGCLLTGETLTLPDATQVAFAAVRDDDSFARIFRSSCRQPLAEEELAARSSVGEEYISAFFHTCNSTMSLSCST
jgi:hypothetical protein